jgi:hypothetical protein
LPQPAEAREAAAEESHWHYCDESCKIVMSPAGTLKIRMYRISQTERTSSIKIGKREFSLLSIKN